ncbi:hypothetical protein PsorP6_014651 [Peronosclerospora sorghi]|uniref:Uncharacterized protein n=1 Tax=Peronosclerospora sorghi TaxID=230839 RepID=A0ACC0VUY3_9STRA|nr:hypothetical protein PsorP6_014651 [Peronosclerospora sorghi]
MAVFPFRSGSAMEWSKLTNLLVYTLTFSSPYFVIASGSVYPMTKVFGTRFPTNSEQNGVEVCKLVLLPINTHNNCEFPVLLFLDTRRTHVADKLNARFLHLLVHEITHNGIKFAKHLIMTAK